MSLSIEIQGLDAINTLLGNFADVMEDEGVMTEAAAILLNQTKTRFLAQETPSGEKWPESQAAKNRAALGIDGGTLFDTGALYHSITVGTTGKMQRSLYTDISYAPDHQFGVGQVQRVFLGFSDEDIATLEELIKVRLNQVDL